MPIRLPKLVEENVVDGIYYSIHDMGLRYSKLLMVHINGKETYHRSIDEANALLFERGCKQPPKTPAERLQEASEAMIKEQLDVHSERSSSDRDDGSEVDRTVR